MTNKKKTKTTNLELKILLSDKVEMAKTYSFQECQAYVKLGRTQAIERGIEKIKNLEYVSNSKNSEYGFEKCKEEAIKSLNNLK
jgi:hypothetical protein